MDESYYRLHAELEESYWWFVAKNRIILEMIRRYGPAPAPGQRACDIGCGAGGLLARLAERFDAVGVDMSPLALAYCAKRGLRAVEGSLPDALALESEAFDVVVASEVLEHVDDDRAAAATLARLLRPGGILVCTVPAHQWLWSRHDDLNHHRRRYTTWTFARLWEGLPLKRIVLSYAQTALFPLMVAARLGERLGASRGHEAVRDEPVKRLPGPINGLFRAAFEAEKHLLGHVPLPIGGSVFSVHARLAAPRDGRDAGVRPGAAPA
jgi:SAM-dependent methyltransferase